MGPELERALAGAWGQEAISAKTCAARHGVTAGSESWAGLGPAGHSLEQPGYPFLGSQDSNPRMPDTADPGA